MSEHAGENRLQRFADRELGSSEAEAMGRHVAACAECGRRLEAIRQAGDAYLAYHNGTLKALDPAPPRPWEDLRPRMTRAHGASWRGWLAAAAAILVAVAGYYRINRAAPVNAAELLRKAAEVEVAPNPARGIYLRVNGRRLVRPAVLSGGRVAAEPQLEALFLAAHFSWEEPLSVRSFAAWRDLAPEKEDRVDVTEGSYQIHTTTRSGPLNEATLVLDSHDLHAMSETLQFSGTRVEIAQAELVATPVPVQPVPAPAGKESPSVPSAAPVLGAAQELRVVAALHAIGADLGDPVQVTRSDESLIVEATGLTPARQQQVRDAIAPIPGVSLRFDVPDAGPKNSAPPARSATASGVRSQLETILGEEGVNRILDASEAVMARVYAVRGLSRRFPPTVEAQLADTDREVLASIRGEHVSGIKTHLASLRLAMATILPKLPPGETPPTANWQVRAGRIFTAAQRLDHLLNRILAGGEDFNKLAPELAEALRQLDAEAAMESRP